MDLNSVSKILKKINRLYELVNEIGEANKTERDLLKAYILDLYDAVTNQDIDDEVDMDLEAMKKKIKKQKKLEKKIKNKKAGNNISEESVTVESQPVVEEPSEIKTISPTPPPKVTPKVDAAIQELFVMDNGNEISDRLSQVPISDLTKAMSINERMFTINELFGGNASEMDNILMALNGLGSFDEAKDVLARSVATKYSWGDAGKFKKAKTFIKLVQRRYK